MNDNKQKKPLAEALVRLAAAKSGKRYCFGDTYGHLLQRLNADAVYYAIADRPHSVKALRAELELRAVEFHRDHGIILSLFPDDVTIERVKQT